jgi:small subunit ribosomal protein S20
MPQIESAKKRLRQNVRCRAANRARKSEMHTVEINFRKAVEAKEFDEAATLLGKVSSLYDKAAKVGVIHRNKAYRKKSRLHSLLARESAG